MKPLSTDLETTILNMMADKNAQPAPAGIVIEPMELDLPEVGFEPMELDLPKVGIEPPGMI